jgi:hypothetical protein
MVLLIGNMKSLTSHYEMAKLAYDKEDIKIVLVSQ